MGRRSLLPGLAVLLFGAGCSSTVTLVYEPPASVGSAGPPLVQIARFRDERSKGPTELGVVRGGYGNVLKRIYTEPPVAEQVTRAFEAALASRGLLGRGEDAVLRLQGSVAKLDCNQYMRREAHAELRVELVRPSTGERLFARSYDAEETGASAATGVFASTGALVEMTERTLREAIDEALDDPDFLAAVAAQREPGRRRAPASDPAERLRELEALREQGLLTPDEYERKRAEILDAL